VRFANENEVYINFVYVDRPFSLSLQYSPPDLLEEIWRYFEKQTFAGNSNICIQNILRFKGLTEDIKKWKEAAKPRLATVVNTSAVETSAWEQRIWESTDEGIAGRDEIKQQLILKIKEVLAEIPEEKHAKLMEMINKFTVARLYEFFQGKQTREVAVLFNEFAG
jgi:sulfur carrier protein ThiS